MKTVLIANPKGGCGKTTLATNLAGYFARQGQRVILSDLDWQHSALHWLARRPKHLPTIHPWDGSSERGFDFDFEPEVIILDTSAGMRGERLKIAVKQVDQVLIPVQPSAFDIDTTGKFLTLLADLKKVRKGKCPLALIANRVNDRTLAAAQLKSFLNTLELPVLSLIRDTQIYVQMAAEGTTLFDLPRYRVVRELEQWRGILQWLGQTG
jgi:chromosome partitioning protein